MLTFFQKFIEDSFQTFNPDVTSLVFADAIISMFWSITLSMIIAMVYRRTHKSISYSQNFTQTLVLLGIIVSAVMLIVGTDIARAFTLVGALSIVRFRNAIKETRDVGFIFFTMAIGMACGTRFYALGIVVTFVGCFMAILMFRANFGQKGIQQDILELTLPKSLDHSRILSPIFTKNLRYYSVLSVDSFNEELNRLSFVITFKKHFKLWAFNSNNKNDTDFKSKTALLETLQKIKAISDVKIINGTTSVEI